jgi:hypothetical protein
VGVVIPARWQRESYERFALPWYADKDPAHNANAVEVLGAFGIAKAFTTGGARGQSYEQTVELYEGFLDRATFVTPTGRALAGLGGCRIIASVTAAAVGLGLLPSAASAARSYSVMFGWNVWERMTITIDEQLVSMSARLGLVDRVERADYLEHLTLVRTNREHFQESMTSLLDGLFLTIQVLITVVILATVAPLLLVFPIFSAAPIAASRWAEARAQRALRESAPDTRTADGEVTGSCVGLRLDRVEVAYGVAVVLPLLLEDHVQAREGGLLAFGVPRIRARRGQHVGCDGGEEVAHHRDATGPDLEHFGVRRCDRREDRHVQAVVLGAGVRLTDGVEWLFDLQDRPAQPRVRGHDQVPQRLRERPLAAHRNVDRASRHRRDALERGRPGALERGPGRAQAIRIAGVPVGAAGKAAVEFSLDEWNHVDAVDVQGAVAVEEPR